jgi:uncharacterized membrane protein YoaK (UPF0700 family)
VIHFDDLSKIYSPKYLWLWFCSAFKAGFINSAGFLATGKFVSHVTGFGTTVGIAFGHDEYFFGAELLIIPISFIMGGVLTSFILDRRYDSNKTPPYYIVQGLITVLIGLIIFLGESGWIAGEAPFDVDEKYNLVEFAVIGLLCLVCGLKNALVTWATQGKIRVTHLTGLSTDIGLHLIRTFNSSQPSPQFKEKRIVNIVRIFTFISFSTGALVSALLFPLVGFKVFFVVMFISVVMTIYSFVDSRRYSLPFEHGAET